MTGEAQSWKRPFSLWLAGFVAIMLVHFVWLRLDRTPPPWDMALHQELGWKVLEAGGGPGFWSRLPSVSSYYPPLYHIQEAVVLRFFGDTQQLPLLANLGGLLMLSLFTWLLGRRLFRESEALIAGWIVLMFPMVAWTSRHTLLDLALAGWVAASLFIIVVSRNLTSIGWSRVLGVVMAAGFLTKWTYPLFVVVPLIVAVQGSRWRGRSLRNLLTACLIAMPFCLYWLLPNVSFLLGERMVATVAQNEARQAPAVLSLASLFYYPRSLLSYYLFLPLTLVLVAAALRNTSRSRLKTVILPLAAGAVLLSLLYVKDPRYIMPLASLLALAVAEAGRSLGRLALRGVGVLALAQFFWVSFQLPLTPPRLALGSRAPDPDYLNLTHEWVFFTSDYYGVMGPPGRQAWPFSDLARQVERSSRIGFVPEQATCHVGLISLESQRAQLGLSAFRVGDTDDWEEGLAQADYVVGKSGAQGISYLTAFSSEVYSALERRAWPLVKEWELPDESRLRLWRNPIRSR